MARDDDEQARRYFMLQHLIRSIGSLEEQFEMAAAELDNADCLRSAAESLQSVRTHFWPLWIAEQQRYRERWSDQSSKQRSGDDGA